MIRRLSHLPAVLPIACLAFCCWTVLADEPGLSITSSLSNPYPAVNEPVELTIVVSNAGPQVARGIVVSNPLPEGLETPLGFAPFLSQGDYSPSTGLWRVDSLAESQSATLVLPLVIDTDSAASVFINEATIIAPLPPGRDAASVKASARLYSAQVASASKVVLEVTSFTNLGGGQDIGFSVANDGPDPVEDVVVSLSISASASTWISSEPAEFGTIGPGETVSGEFFHRFYCEQGAYTASYTVTLTSSSSLSSDSVTTVSDSFTGTETGPCVI